MVYCLRFHLRKRVKPCYSKTGRKLGEWIPSIRLVPKVIPVKLLFAMVPSSSTHTIRTRVKSFRGGQQYAQRCMRCPLEKNQRPRIGDFSTLLGFVTRDYPGINVHTDNNCLTLYLLLVLVAMFEVQYIKHEKQCFMGISKHREKSWEYDAQRSIFWRNSRCLDSRWNTVSSVWYIFSIETKTME